MECKHPNPRYTPVLSMRLSSCENIQPRTLPVAGYGHFVRCVALLFLVGHSDSFSRPSPRSSLDSVPFYSTHNDIESDLPPCFYRSPTSRKWEKRLELSELSPGQELTDCHVVQELLSGKTGPKLFCDCGVGRCRNLRWKIVTAMLRLDRKESVARKRAARLRDEVSNRPSKVPVSSIRVGSEIAGIIVRLEPYGAIVDVGANRHGLLHIQKVADLYGRYINKARGLVEAGMERGARVRLAVASNQSKRLFLDFTDDVKESAATEREQQKLKFGSESRGNKRSQRVDATLSKDTVAEQSDVRQVAPRIAPDTKEEEDDDDDDYDEDREIEDALGLGYY